MVRRIYLDFDDVLFDFTGRMLAMHGVSWAEAQKRWPPNGGLTIHKALGWSARDLARALDHKADRIWARNVRQPSWAASLWEGCNDIAPTSIVTKPTDWCRSVEPKLAWVKAKFGKGAASRMIFTFDRAVVSAPDNVLIDDSQQNCNEFVGTGGHAILFPRYHNEGYDIAEGGGMGSVRAVLSELRQL